MKYEKLTLNKIESVGKSKDSELGGYEIKFNDGRTIHLTKRRTVIAMLVLIHKGSGSESDLAAGNKTIPEIRKILSDRLEAGVVNDAYGDANKPYSELWNEEGFSFIENVSGNKINRSQAYRLDPSYHDHLFLVKQKAHRSAPSNAEFDELFAKQKGKCNFCGSLLFSGKKISKETFARDHRRVVADHRAPVEKGGTSSTINNYQLLCFYCNKSKWQICNICSTSNCDNCALAYPEKTKIVFPTKEDISDRLSAIVDNRIKTSK